MAAPTVRRWLVASLAAFALSATTAAAQGKKDEKEKGKAAEKAQVGKANGNGPGFVPPGHMPRPGECRVWFDNRPPGQQPKATSCAAARRDAARNGGRVLYGSAADERPRSVFDRILRR